jgi:bacterial/archaeal transporter family-2 protein
VLAVSSTAFAAVLAAAAGLAGAVQIAVQGRLNERVGSIEAAATASVIGAVLAVLILLAARRSLGGVGDAVAGPKWQLLGGAMSILIILSITIAGPRIGVVATTAFLIAAQFALAAVIDRYGWFGVERVALTWPRVLGLGLLIAGAALTLRR